MLTTSIAVSIFTMIAPYRHPQRSSLPQDPIMTKNQNTRESFHGITFRNWGRRTKARTNPAWYGLDIVQRERGEPRILPTQQSTKKIQILTICLFAFWLLDCLAGMTGVISITIPRYPISLAAVKLVHCDLRFRISFISCP